MSIGSVFTAVFVFTILPTVAIADQLTTILKIAILTFSPPTKSTVVRLAALQIVHCVMNLISLKILGKKGSKPVSFPAAPCLLSGRRGSGEAGTLVPLNCLPLIWSFMTDKKKEKITALTIRMSRENLYRLKEQALEARMKLREYVHMVLGLEIQEEEKNEQ
jgi:hypothetical protein